MGIKSHKQIETRVAHIFSPKSKNKYFFDQYLQSFNRGIPDARLSIWNKDSTIDSPLLIRGINSHAREAIYYCQQTKKEFYYIDTGYIGNERSNFKRWHRITKNSLQNTGPIINRPTDRLKIIGTKCQKMYSGSKILICPPSAKVMKMYNQPLPEIWTKNVIKKLKKFTDRPIEIRLKPQRKDRISVKTIEDALVDDVYCLVTYNSIAALEALINGKPAITLGENCASSLCNTSLNDIENLNKPSRGEVIKLLAHLSYGQFTKKEMTNGVAWRILNEDC